MPLYDITNTRPVLVKPADAESYEVLQAVKAKVPSVTFQRMVKTIDEAIESCDPTDTSKLVWTKSAALFGYGSLRPKANVDHLWTNVIASVGEDKNALRAVGGMLRWRISLRQEMWLVYRREDSEQKIDPDTGRTVTVSEYWINEKFVPPTKVIIRRKSLEDLASAWGAKITTKGEVHP